jgi:hypothetical protein
VTLFKHIIILSKKIPVIYSFTVKRFTGSCFIVRIKLLCTVKVSNKLHDQLPAVDFARQKIKLETQE